MICRPGESILSFDSTLIVAAISENLSAIERENVEMPLRNLSSKRPVLAGVYMVRRCRDDVWMADFAMSGGLEAGPRRRRSAMERRRIVEEKAEAGASVARRR